MSYTDLSSHASMVFDARRNAMYESAIHRLVTPGSVVLDLGAGAGLHGLMAAKAGARRVYLVEPEGVVTLAREAAQHAGVADRIEILQQRIEDVRLPQPVDLIVSVFTGNLLYSEDLLPLLFEARDRLLKPGGRVLPGRSRLLLAPLSAPALHDKHIARWSSQPSGFQYGHARAVAANEILWLRRADHAGTQRLGPAAVIADVDLQTATDASCRGEVRAEITASGLCHGLSAWIELDLLDATLSTAPDAPDVHWVPPVLPLDPPLPLEAGETVTLSLHRPVGGEWTWAVKARAGTRRHSTFLSRLQTAAQLQKVAPGGKPGLSPQGRRAIRILQLFAEGLSNESAAGVLARETSLTEAQALREVQAAARRYGAGA
jgi:SAM-dependent methyltransferase